MTFQGLKYGLFSPTSFKDAFGYCSSCLKCQEVMNLKMKDSMLLNPIIEVEIFYLWRIVLMGPFMMFDGYEYIFMAIDYVSRWVEAILRRSNDHKNNP